MMLAEHHQTYPELDVHPMVALSILLSHSVFKDDEASKALIFNVESLASFLLRPFDECRRLLSFLGHAELFRTICRVVTDASAVAPRALRASDDSSLALQ